MNNLNSKLLSENDIANHAAIQTQKSLEMQLRSVESERDLFKLLLKNLYCNAQDDTGSVEIISSRLLKCSEFFDMMLLGRSYVQLNIDALLISMRIAHHSQINASGINIYFEDFPALTGDKLRTEALFSNLLLFSIHDVIGTRSIHIEYEATQFGNRLLWEIDCENIVGLPGQSIMMRQSSFFALAKQLAPSLCAQIGMHVTTNKVLIELRFE